VTKYSDQKTTAHHQLNMMSMVNSWCHCHKQQLISCCLWQLV